MDLAPLITRKRERFAELEDSIGSGAAYADPRKSKDILREHMRLKELLTTWDALHKARAEHVENTELAKGTDELAEMAQAELPLLDEKIAKLDREVQLALLPPDPDEDKDAIVEIRAGTGGDEAGLFAADLYRMYTRYAETEGLKIENLESSPGELGGFKEVIFKVTGTGVFRKLRYESGVHRVQRVPATETQGRIHTSAATVAVLPEAEEVDLQLNPTELEITVCRSGGPGGQGVNTTDSAVQVVHIPTGTTVRCQDGRSQIKNREKALTILRSRLLERKRQDEAAKYAAQRKNQVGSGDRSEKIRTYNYPQNRITDHRVEVTLYNLDQFMEGRIAEIIEALQRSDMEERLAAVQG